MHLRLWRGFFPFMYNWKVENGVLIAFYHHLGKNLSWHFRSWLPPKRKLDTNLQQTEMSLVRTIFRRCCLHQFIFQRPGCMPPITFRTKVSAQALPPTSAKIKEALLTSRISPFFQKCPKFSASLGLMIAAFPDPALGGKQVGSSDVIPQPKWKTVKTLQSFILGTGIYSHPETSRWTRDFRFSHTG